MKDLNIKSSNVDYGIESGPSPLIDFKEIMKNIKDNVKNTIFIDIGSGLGRAILLATEYNFTRFIGVEFSDELNQLAKRNIDNFRKKSSEKRDIELLTEDAVDFVFPLEPLTIYMFNPFGPEVLVPVIKNLILSAKNFAQFNKI